MIIVPASSAPSVTPASPSLNDLQCDLLEYVVANPDPENEKAATRALNNAIRKINSRNWNHLLGSQDISLVASDFDYDLAATYRRPRSAHPLNTSDQVDGRPLGYTHLPDFTRGIWSLKNTGTPRSYTIIYNTRQVFFDVAPDATFISSYPKIRLRFHARVPELLSGGGTFGAPSEFAGFIVWQGRFELAAIRAPQKVQAAKIQADQCWRQLIRDDTDIMTDWQERAYG